MISPISATELARKLVAILADLIAIPSTSPPGESTAIAAYAAGRLQRAGLATEIVSRKVGVDNVVASLGQGTPRVVFNAHMDTVGVGERAAWTSDPFTAELRDGNVFGLGAGNCKGSMAVQLWLAEELARRGGPQAGEVTFTFVADEENLGPDGMAFLRQAGHVKPDVLILGAQTENQLIVAERGVLWARIATFGRAAHAGAPDQGDNAILRMVRVLAAIERDLAPKLTARRAGEMRSTLNVGLIRGGHNTNVVPASCSAEIDRRLLPGESVEAALEELRRVVAGAGEAPDQVAVEFLTGTNGFSAPEGGQGVAALAAEIASRTGKRPRFLNATGVSDGRYFADDRIEIVNFGPGSGAQGHAANESVPLDQMVDAALIQAGTLGRLVGFKRG